MSSNAVSAVPDGDRLVVIAGATAVGKSEVALEAAARVGGEILAADSITVYRGLDRGTAKPSPADRARLPHHLLDLIDPAESFSVAQYQALAREMVAAVNRRDRIPFLVGGTGLYVSAVVDYAWFPPVPPRPGFRASLAAADPADLHRRLQAADRGAAARIHPGDRRRLIRALEVLSHPAVTAAPAPRYDLLMFGLDRPRAELYHRVEARVDHMLAAGLVEEVAALRARGLTRGHQAMQALGYKEIMGYLEGEYSLDRAVYLLKRDTRRYAKRQLTWFRRDRRIAWITLGEDRGTGQVAADIAAQVAARWDPVVE